MEPSQRFSSKYFVFFSAFYLCFVFADAQDFSAGINVDSPNPNAVLHLVSPNGNQGLLVPRLTTVQRTAMSLSATDNGILVYDETDNSFYFWNGASWIIIANTDNQALANVLSNGADAAGTVITNVGEPVDPQDVATKNYVDTRPSQDPVSSDAGNVITIGTDGGALLANVDDADADPTNENQTVSAGTGITVTQAGNDFQVTNAAPDQVVSIVDGGSGNVTVGGTYPNLTIDVPAATDEQDLTLVGNTLAITGDPTADVDLTPYLDDQVVSIADGGSGNVTVGGTYPNLTVDVPTLDDADADPTNENQTVSAGTGITVTPAGNDFQVTNAAPDQVVSIADGGSGNVTVGGTYPNLTIDVPAATDEQDLTLVGNTLAITGDPTADVDLTPYLDDQVVSIADGGSGNVTVGGTYPNLTVDVPTLDDADADPTNENQTVSAGTGITVTPAGNDFQVTNAAPDQVVSIADGGSGNITVGGTYPNLTVDVPTLDDADADPTNENQTVSAGTGITVTPAGNDFQVTNAAPDQVVSIADGGSGNVTVGGTYPNLTIDVPAATDEQDLTLVGNTLAITGDPTADVDLTPYLDDQVVSIADGGSGNVTVGGTYPNLTVDVPTLDDADADPTNENQTVSAGTGITVTPAGNDFQVTNAAPDQVVSIADGGSGNVTVGGTYPNLTVDVPTLDDADADPTNENQTVSAGAGITVTPAGNDFQVTNAAPDQVVSIADGGSGNLTVGGTYPNLTVDVPSLDDADADPTNENQTVSAGTGITVTPAGNDFQVTNAAPDQVVSIADGGSGNVTIGGTYPSLTVDVPTLDDADADPSNEIELPTQSGADSGLYLQADGVGGVSYAGVNVDDADADPSNEIELPTQSGADSGLFLQADGVGGVSYAADNVDDADNDPTNELDLSNHTTFTAPADGDLVTWDNVNGRWDALAPSPTLSSGNGVTINTSNIDLGGTLTGPATITTGAGSNDLTVDGAGAFISSAAIGTFINSATINLGDAGTDNINIFGQMVFEEGANDLILDVLTQSTATGTLVVPDLAGGTETLALLSDLSGGVTNLTTDVTFSSGGPRQVAVNNNPTGAGDNLTLKAGSAGLAASAGGSVLVNAGTAQTSGVNGNIILTPGYNAGIGADGFVGVNGNLRIGNQDVAQSGAIELEDAGGANALTLRANPSSALYEVTMPPAQGTGSLTNDGLGNLSWAAGGGLSNLTTDITFASGSPRLLGVNNNPTGAGDNLTLEAGSAGLAASDGGNFTINAGDAQTSGVNGNINLIPGYNGVGQDGILNVDGVVRIGHQSGTVSGAIELEDAGGANAMLIRADPSSAAYSVTLPPAQGTGSLTNDGLGNLTWATGGGLTLPYADSGADPSNPLFDILNTSGTAASGAFGNASNFTPALQTYSNLGGVGDVAGGVGFAGLNSGASYQEAALIRASVVDNTAATYTGNLVFEVANGGFIEESMRIAQSGDVLFPEGINRQVAVSNSTTGAGGNLLLAAGDGDGGSDGGNIELGGGAGFNFGGSARVVAGGATNASGTAGDVEIIPGNAPNPANRGIVNMISPTAVRIPTGTNAERPGILNPGLIRFNTDLTTFEGNVDGTSGGWVDLAATGGGFSSSLNEIADQEITFGSTVGPANSFGATNFQLGAVAPTGKAFLSASSFNGSASELRLTSANGPQAGPVTQTLNGDALGEIIFEGFAGGGGNYQFGSVIRSRAIENWTGTGNLGTELLFGTASAGTGTIVDVMTLRDGSLDVTGTATITSSAGGTMMQLTNVAGTGLGINVGQGFSVSPAITLTQLGGRAIEIGPSAFIDGDGSYFSAGGNITTTTGSIGIGATPVNRLDVEGGMVVGATYSGTNAAPTNGMLIEGRLGIGNDTPSGSLDVDVALGSAYVRATSNITFGLLQIDQAGTGDASTRLSIPGQSATYGLDAFDNSFKINMGTLITDVSDFTIDPAGNVGIGTSLPGSTLDVNGDANVAADFSLGGNLISAISGPFNTDPVASDTRIVRLDGGPITQITAGLEGQEIILVASAASIDIIDADNGGTNIQLANNDTNYIMNVNATLHMVYIGSFWIEISRSIQP